MNDLNMGIRNHYTQTDLLEGILSALQAAGKDINNLARDDLIAVEEFHTRGREATRELGQRAGLKPGMMVLDLGSGIGGPARTLAMDFGCNVIGLDLTPDFIRAAADLSKRLGLDGKLSFQEGDMTQLTFADQSFDVVWSQHALMNVEDKPRVLQEIRRVLRPGGVYAFHEVFAGPGGPPHYPVPWAETADISRLVTPLEFHRELEQTELDLVEWQDQSEDSTLWFEKAAARLQSLLPQTVALPGQSLLMGATFEAKFRNMVRNLQENRIRIIMAVAEAGE